MLGIWFLNPVASIPPWFVLELEQRRHKMCLGRVIVLESKGSKKAKRRKDKGAVTSGHQRTKVKSLPAAEAKTM